MKKLNPTISFGCLLLAGCILHTAGGATSWYPVTADGEAEGKPGDREILTIENRESTGDPWATGPGYQCRLILPGETKACLLRFEGRVSAGGTEQYDHAIRMVVSDETGKRRLFRGGPHLNGNWETYQAGFFLPENWDLDTLLLTAAYGWGHGDVEIRNMEMVPLAQKPRPEDWKRLGHWYAGQDPGADWRKKAGRMIERNRMSGVRVRVVGKTGKPLKGAKVVLEQQSHAYRFGTAVATQRFRWMRADGLDPSRESAAAATDRLRRKPGRERWIADSRRYFEEIVANFNYFVVENGLKPKPWNGEWTGFRRADTLAAIDWLLERGLEGKGHVLVWPGWRHAPDFYERLSHDPGALDAIVKAHITDVGSRMNGRLGTFDVLNEPFNNNDFMKILGDGVMSEWFRTADQVLPGARLALNDFLLIANGGRWSAKLDFYDRLVERLLEENAPLDVIGFQNHYRHTFLTSPERVWELCDRFGRFGLPLECSEFDVVLEDEELQAAFMRDFLTAWFAHPATRAFLFWGFWEAEHWLPQAALLTRDWRAKPAYHAYRDLVFNKWWTGLVSAETGTDGVAEQRVFHGTYRISVTVLGQTERLEGVRVAPGGDLDLVVRM